MGIAPNRNPHVTLTWAPSGNKETRTPEGNMDENSGEGAELGLTSWAAEEAVTKNRDKLRRLMSCPVPHPWARN